MITKLQAIRKKHPEGDLVMISKRVIEKMENNPDFPDPPAALAALKMLCLNSRLHLLMPGDATSLWDL
jgi:hypothetical protein